MGLDLNMPIFRLSPNMNYASPGAGSVALECNHGVRYPDLCGDCFIDKTFKSMKFFISLEEQKCQQLKQN